MNLVVSGSFIIALRASDGSEVWRQERTTRRSWATPLVVKGPQRVEMITAGAEMVVSYDARTGRELWRANGTQSHPIPSAVAGHGLVVLTAGSQAKRAMAIKLGGDGNLVDSPAIVWRYAKGTAYVPSPILVGPTGGRPPS
jgi:outer membrane protein assembly factor BamB